ncbi:MAG: long-chain-fatty-acid--CoA ligase [Gammaproteobacteria bacterium RIFCSPHIGHO2_12_FULL_63_22]|nr:MAG: long-chain-fatty-acid--CoA ligase [Gammaproteobacteria bacterium RIFCSPHIGHO2_12_FULL_63_22]
MDKFWLGQYPPGVEADVDINAYASIRDILESTCQRFGELPAYSNMGASIRYCELDRLSRDFGAYLQQVAGMHKGDRIALMLPNLLQYPVSLFGALRAGMVVVNVNPLYTPRELEYQLKDSGATVIVILENFAHTLEQVMARVPIKRVITTQVGDLFPAAKRLLTNLVVKHVKKMVPAWRLEGAVPFNTVLKLGRDKTLQDIPLDHNDIAFLQYTGGTTGVAKGTVLTHGNLVSNMQQLAAWISRDLVEGRECAILPLPLYHIYALIANLVFMKIGAHVVLITNPRDIPDFLKTLDHHHPTVMIGVNTLYNALLNAPGFEAVDLGKLKLACAGGMAVQRSVAERWKKATGTPLVEGYGLTETSPVVTSNLLSIKDWTGTVGLPLPSTEVSVIDDDGGHLARGERGELAVRGPQVMRGYWNRPEETAKVFTQDGWLRTGDIGYLDEKGYCRITDRKKDIIIVSGFKVFPNEIEDVVAMHPGVLEVAAVGVPDPSSGEAVKIVVVKKDPALTEAGLIAHCRENLTGYKIPKLVEFRTEPLPKSNIGKVLRRLLRDPPAAAAA